MYWHNNKKILFVAPISVYGGGDIYFLDIIRGMKSRGYALEVWFFPRADQTGLGKFCDELKKAKVGYSVKPSPSGAYSRIVSQFCRGIKELNPAIIHFNQGAPSCNRLQMAAAYKLGIPFVSTSHLPIINNGRARFGFPKTPLALREWCYPWEADSYITTTQRNAELMIVNQGISRSKIDVISLGLDFEKFNRKDKNYQIFSAYDIKPHHFVIGSVGNLNARKAQHIFIKAAATMKKRVLSKDIRFVLCGGGEREQELKELIKECGIDDCFKLVGHIDRSLIPEVLGRFDIFCMSSDMEGQVYTILEALRCGLPVVTTAAGGIENVEDGRNGFLVPKGDYNEMAKRLTQIVEDDVLREKMVDYAVSSIDARYTLPVMLDKTEGVYEKVLSAAPSRKRGGNFQFRYAIGEVLDFFYPVLYPFEKYVLQSAAKVKQRLTALRKEKI